jgi:hypothetical protein
MAIYFISQFKKIHHHQKGAYNVDIKRFREIYHNLPAAYRGLARIMDSYRRETYLRLDRNVLDNPIAFADLDTSGGIVRFLKRDREHWTTAITLDEFIKRLR